MQIQHRFINGPPGAMVGTILDQMESTEVKIMFNNDWSVTAIPENLGPITSDSLFVMDNESEVDTETRDDWAKAMDEGTEAMVALYGFPGRDWWGSINPDGEPGKLVREHLKTDAARLHLVSCQSIYDRGYYDWHGDRSRHMLAESMAFGEGETVVFCSPWNHAPVDHPSGEGQYIPTVPLPPTKWYEHQCKVLRDTVQLERGTSGAAGLIIVYWSEARYRAQLMNSDPLLPDPMQAEYIDAVDAYSLMLLRAALQEAF